MDISGLPLELLEVILDFVWSKNSNSETLETLSDCSLVSRAWVHPSQRRLFHELNIHQSSFLSHPNLMGEFIDFLKDCPHIAKSIRDLVLDMGYSRTYPDRHKPLCRHNISDILTSLSGLQSLDLQDVPLHAFCECHRSGDYRIPGTFSLCYLYITNAHARSAKGFGHFDFLSVLSVFAEITHFSLFTMEITGRYIPGVTESSPHGQLCLPPDTFQKLCVRNVDFWGWSDLLFDVLNSPNGPTKDILEGITFEPTTHEDIQSFGKALQMYPNSVRHVKFDSFNAEDYIAIGEPNSPHRVTPELQVLGSGLQACLSLQGVKFNINTRFESWTKTSDYSLRYQMQTTALIISFLPPSTRKITFYLSLDAAEKLSVEAFEENICWDEIQMAVVGLGVVEEVRFEWWRGSDDSEAIRFVVRNRFPLLLRRGLLKF